MLLQHLTWQEVEFLPPSIERHHPADRVNRTAWP